MTKQLNLTLRHQEPRTTGRAGWRVIEHAVTWEPATTSIIVVDMWDQHWSWGASERANMLAPRINTVIGAARRRGVHIVHAPSDVIDFYQDHPARRNTLAVPQLPLPLLAEHLDPPLPIDDKDGGSDTGETDSKAVWTRQHAAIEIWDGDSISANDQEILSLLNTRQITQLLYVGVHLNMCVLHRPFGIKRLTRWGFTVALARDLTDTMYNPARPPYVSHDEGTQLVVGYVEKFWCPTFSGDDLTV